MRFELAAPGKVGGERVGRGEGGRRCERGGPSTLLSHHTRSTACHEASTWFILCSGWLLPIWPKIWLILGPNQPQTQTRLRAPQNLTISTEFSWENRKNREKRKENRWGARGKPRTRTSQKTEGGPFAFRARAALSPAPLRGLNEGPKRRRKQTDKREGWEGSGTRAV